MRTTRSKKKIRPALILVNFLIVILILGGSYLILKPIVIHWLQDKLTANLADSYEQGDGMIEINPAALEVPGEEVEYVEAMETFTTSSASESGQQTTVTSPTTIVPPTPSPLPAKVTVTAIGRIQIPVIKLNMPIAEGSTVYNLRVAIGHYSASADFGQPGYSIYLGHRMYTYGRHFNRLNEVAVGDDIILSDKHFRYTYEVDKIETIKPAELISALNRQTTEARIMLVTCTPVKVASHRLLVIGKLIKTEALP